MAKILQAVNTYGPKLELNPAVEIKELAEWISSRTGLNKSELRMALEELGDGITFFNKRGSAVKLPELGTFGLSVDRHGNIKSNFRATTARKKALGTYKDYGGRIKNKEAIGLDNEGYQEKWDVDHPDDLLQI